MRKLPEEGTHGESFILRSNWQENNLQGIQENMSKQNLFVGSLAYATTEDSLKDFFSQVGEVSSAKVIVDHESNRSKGFGFVEMVNDDDNQKAVDQLNGKELDGREITVSLARPREERPRRDFGGNNGGGDRRGNGGNRDNGGSFRQRSW